MEILKTCAVIIPACKSENFITDCLKSFDALTKLSGWKYELRIGVDACEKTAQAIDRDYYFIKKNSGSYITRNTMHSIGQADAYCYFDADDVFMNNFLTACLEKIDKGADIVVPAKTNTDENLNPGKSRIENGGAMVYTDEVWKGLGGFYPARMAADSDFLDRAKIAGFRITEIQEPLYFRRRHKAALTCAKDTKQGSEARKKAWAEMAAAREAGKIKIDPVVAEYEKRTVKPADISSLAPVYILIRTSARPAMFKKMMQSVNTQSYKKIITIVHSDNSEDNYITGDIIIRGEKIKKININPETGKKKVHTGPYNFYCNRLLDRLGEAVKEYGEGWYFFLDDDDKFIDNEVIKNFVANAKEDYVNVARVRRYGKVYPPDWGNAVSFHTESFFLHTKHRDLARWWGGLGGDHNYSRQIAERLDGRVNWIDNFYSCSCQTGKGHGLPEIHLKQHTISELNAPVWVLYLRDVRIPSICRGKSGELKQTTMKRALELDRRGKVKINPTGPEFEKKKKEIENIKIAKMKKLFNNVKIQELSK